MCHKHLTTTHHDRPQGGSPLHLKHVQQLVHGLPHPLVASVTPQVPFAVLQVLERNYDVISEGCGLMSVCMYMIYNLVQDVKDPNSLPGTCMLCKNHMHGLQLIPGRGGGGATFIDSC